MALSKRAEALKAQLQQVVTGKRELEALELEWRALLEFEEERLCEQLCGGEMPCIEELYHERLALRRQVAVWQLENYRRLQHVTMSGLQRQIMRLRYIQGKPWGEMEELLCKTRQYLLRQHNKVLERMVTSDYTPPMPKSQKTA